MVAGIHILSLFICTAYILACKQTETNVCLKETEKFSIVLEGWGDPDTGALSISAQPFSMEFPIGAAAYCTSQRRGGGCFPIDQLTFIVWQNSLSHFGLCKFLMHKPCFSLLFAHVSCLFHSVSFSFSSQHIPFR